MAPARQVNEDRACVLGARLVRAPVPVIPMEVPHARFAVLIRVGPAVGGPDRSPAGRRAFALPGTARAGMSRLLTMTAIIDMLRGTPPPRRSFPPSAQPPLATAVGTAPRVPAPSR